MPLSIHHSLHMAFSIIENSNMLSLKIIWDNQQFFLSPLVSPTFFKCDNNNKITTNHWTYTEPKIMLQTFRVYSNLMSYYIIIFILHMTKLGLAMWLVYLDTFSKWQRQDPNTVMICTLRPFIHEIQYTAFPLHSLVTDH